MMIFQVKTINHFFCINDIDKGNDSKTRKRIPVQNHEL